MRVVPVPDSPSTRRDREGIDTAIYLQPIAAPAVLGNFALGSFLILFGVWLAGGLPPDSPKSFFEFILLFSGVGQLAAALWSYRARSAVGASIHGAWGAFALGFGILELLGTAGAITLPPIAASSFPAMGQWLIYMAVITWTTAFAALARSPAAFLGQATLGTATAMAAAALLSGAPGWLEVAGWLFVAAAAGAFYIGAAIMVNLVHGRILLPLLTWRREDNVPGSKPMRPIEFAEGEPGVKVGQ
jgi:succinate-acetate transporter protein